MSRSLTVLLGGGSGDLPEVWEAPSGGTGEPMKIPLGNGCERFDSVQEYADFEGDSRPRAILAVMDPGPAQPVPQVPSRPAADP